MSELNKPISYPIITGRPEPAAQKPSAKPVQNIPGPSFGELLHKSIEQNQTRQLTFSKHAQTRTEQRGIELTDADIQRLEGAVGKAGEKGVTDTLVFMNNTAFIVNVPNRVVVTVMDGTESEDSVFTNIDGAVIL